MGCQWFSEAIGGNEASEDLKQVVKEGLRRPEGEEGTVGVIVGVV